MITIILIAVFLVGCATPRRVVQVITASGSNGWGDWGEIQYCPDGSYAVGFRLKVEAPCGRCDDTSMNGIQLSCASPPGRDFGGITSSVGPWGSWTATQSCKSGYYLSAFRMDTEPKQGNGDDTSVNNVNVMCRSSSLPYGTMELAGNSPTSWGHRQRWSSSCRIGSAVCGLKTRVEVPQGRGDDTALNDIIMYCCEY